MGEMTGSKRVPVRGPLCPACGTDFCHKHGCAGAVYDSAKTTFFLESLLQWSFFIKRKIIQNT